MLRALLTSLPDSMQILQPHPWTPSSLEDDIARLEAAKGRAEGKHRELQDSVLKLEEFFPFGVSETSSRCEEALLTTGDTSIRPRFHGSKRARFTSEHHRISKRSRNSFDQTSNPGHNLPKVFSGMICRLFKGNNTTCFAPRTKIE